MASVSLEVIVEPAIGARCAVTGVGPPGCQQVVIVVERSGTPGLAPVETDRVVREALSSQPIAAVLVGTAGIKARLDDSGSSTMTASAKAGGPALKAGKPAVYSTRNDAAIR